MTALVSGKPVSSKLRDSIVARFLFRYRRWIVAVLVPLWVAAVIASHIPQENLPPLPANGKILHSLGFFGLASLFVLALAAYGQGPLRRNLWALLVFAAYAAFDEGTQPYFHRHGSAADWALDTGSALLALALWQVVLLGARLVVERTHRAREMQRKVNAYLYAHCRNL